METQIQLDPNDLQLLFDGPVWRPAFTVTVDGVLINNTDGLIPDWSGNTNAAWPPLTVDDVWGMYSQFYGDAYHEYTPGGVVDTFPGWGNLRVTNAGTLFSDGVGGTIGGQSGVYAWLPSLTQTAPWWNIPFTGDVSEYNAQVLVAMAMSDMVDGDTGIFQTGWWQAYIPVNVSQATKDRAAQLIQAAMQNNFNAYENQNIDTFDCPTQALADFFGMPRRTFLAIQRAMLGRVHVADIPYIVPVYDRITTPNGEFQNGMQHMAEHPCGSTYHGDFNLTDPANIIALALALPTGGASLAFGAGAFGVGTALGFDALGLVAMTGQVLVDAGDLQITIGGTDITTLVMDMTTSGFYSLDAASQKMVTDIQNGTFTIADIGHVMNKLTWTMNPVTDIGNITVGESTTNVIKALVIAAVGLAASGALTALANGTVSMKQALAIAQFGVMSYLKVNALVHPITPITPLTPGTTTVVNPATGTVTTVVPLTVEQTVAAANQAAAQGLVPTGDSGFGIGMLVALGAYIVMNK